MRNSQATQTVEVKTEDSLLLSKLSKLLAACIIFFSATQLGLHLWPLSSLVYGIRVDYLAPTLYFLDLLIILFLAIKGSDLKGGAQPVDSKAGRSDPIGVISPILLVNLLYSQNPLATLNWSLHFLFYFSFLITLFPKFRSLGGLQQSKRQIGTSVISTILTLSLLFQLALAITQVYLGHSIGGFVYYLGERSVAVGQPAVALGTFMDAVVLRSYATFGHPNVLAGWAVVSLLIILRLRPQGLTLKEVPNPAVSKAGKVRPYWNFWRPGQILWVLITIFIILLTQSRSASLALFGVIIPFYLIQKVKLRLIYFLILFCSIFFIFQSSPPSRSDLSTSERLTLQSLSLSVIKTYPVLGTGAQASISTYPNVSPTTRLLQPDHNVLTLFLSWFGLFGVFAILYSIRSSLRSTFHFIFPLIPLLLFDHYLLTSPQGIFILFLYLRVTMGYEL